MGKLWSICEFFLFFLSIFIFNDTKSCLGADNCFEQERQALLQFKQSLLSDSSNQLSSWDGRNCCQWQGVSCDNSTGHVIRLDLGSNSSFNLQANELNSSLAELTHLSYMDLSSNHFGGNSVPEFIGSMTQLRFLNLSSAGFVGIVPRHIGNLSNLNVLDLSDSFNRGLYVDDFTWVSRLLSLRHLDLSGVDASEARNLDNVLFYKIPSLLELRLSRCGLLDSHFARSHLDSNITLSNIRNLDLSSNSFEGKFPLFLQNMTFLRVLDLSNNNFNSSIPGMNNLVQLNLAGNNFQSIQDTGVWSQCRIKSFDLSLNYIRARIVGPSINISGCAKFDMEKLVLNDNYFSGEIPTSLERLASLKELSLDYNQLTGLIPESLGNLTSLRKLDLSSNQLEGSIPTSMGRLMALRKLDLSFNMLNGTIPFSIGQLLNLEILYLSFNMLTTVPFSIGNLSKLKFLDLSSNSLHGELPNSLGQLSELQFLDVSNNSLEGVVTEAHFANMSMLKHLDATSNHMLTFKIRPDWTPPFQISHILLGSCKIASEFPRWIQTQRNLVILMLSNASISGPLPMWLRDLPVIMFLDLSHNLLSGPLTNLPSNQTTKPLRNFPFVERLETLVNVAGILLLKNNRFNGSIPESLCNRTDLDILDLSRNMLSGDLPHCLENLQQLRIMILSSNRLSGVIPSSLGHLGESLDWLHLNNNSFYGELPATLANCTGLSLLDLGENRFSGTIPKWIGEKIKFLAVLRLHNNNFNGSIPKELCQESSLQILDLGINNLTGNIPRCFENLRGMAGGDSELYFSGGFEQSLFQVMRGVPLEYTTIMRYVVNMDLSSNNLVGEIPKELTFLSGLLGLNLSHNRLTGRIPDRIGDLNSLMSLDFSVNNLSGVIPVSLSNLTFLSHLNLSNNNFSGRIPTGSQLRTLVDPSIYAGNNELCGSPLQKRCNGDEVSTNGINNEEDEEKEDDGDDDDEKVGLYLAITGGFVTGFWGFVGVLMLMKGWRLVFFHFVEVCANKITMRN